MVSKKWKKRPGGGNFWDPKEGEEVIGKLEAIRQGNFNRNVFDIRTPDGIVTIPSSTILDGMIKEEDLDKDLRIIFKGWGKGKGGDYRKYEVYDEE
jgi:hypothetical protein